MSVDSGRAAPSPLVALRYALLLVAIAAALFYFQWRLGVLNPAFLAYSWIVFAAEIVGFARTLMFLLSAVRVSHHTDVPPSPSGLTVDVFIPTLNEPLDVVRRTALAALAIRYPHETWLLDDGGRAEMRDLATAIGCRYIARADHADAKAGNLNNALSLTQGQFVAIFDADHVADPRFLDRILGYFSDERLAFVQTTQEFFNADSFDHIRPARKSSNGASFFHRIVQRSRDASNATIFSGTSGVLRRSALDSIGGFATGTISEDVATSLHLHAAGWRSACHPEILSAGMGPLNAAGYCGQRLRWSQDSLQLLLRERLLTDPGLTSRQRLAYLIHVASNLEGWRHLFTYALPIVILFSGIVPLKTDPVSFLLHFVPYFLALTLATSEFARGHGRIDESAVYNLARCPASLIAVFTAHRERRFNVTPKARDTRRRLPQSAFTDAVLLLTLSAMAFACGEAFAGNSPLDGGTLAILMAWATYHVVTAVRLLMLEGRCARDRRASTRFEGDLQANITRVDEPHSAHTVDVVVASANGFTLRARDGAPLPPAATYQGEVEISDTHFRFELTLRDRGCGGPVRWPDDVTRAKFDLLLHQLVIEELAGSDQGDAGGVFRSAELNRRRYPKPSPSLVSKKP